MLQVLLHKPDVLMGCDSQTSLFTITETINCAKLTLIPHQDFTSAILYIGQQEIGSPSA